MEYKKTILMVSTVIVHLLLFYIIFEGILSIMYASFIYGRFTIIITALLLGYGLLAYAQLLQISINYFLKGKNDK